MQFDNKIHRAREAQRRALGLDQPEVQKARREEERAKLERGDLFSLLLSSFYMLFLPCVVVLCLLLMAVCLLFGMLPTVLPLLLPILGTAVVLWLLITLLMRHREKSGRRRRDRGDEPKE